MKIEVSTPPNEPTRRMVRVQADWPEDAPARARVSKQATVELSPAAKAN